MAVDKFQADWIFLTLLAGPTYIKNEMNPFDPRRHGGGGRARYSKSVQKLCRLDETGE
mgnify:CR=1 FL=1